MDPFGGYMELLPALKQSADAQVWNRRPMPALDKAALSTALVPGIGDVLGLAADARRFAQEPESRTPLNMALSGLGLLPFVPSLGMLRSAVSPADQAALGGSVVFHGGSFPSSAETFDLAHLGTGEPGGFRAQGPGFYGSNSRELAARYAKYAPHTRGKVTEFEIDDMALLYPRGSVWRRLSSDYTRQVEDALQRADELLRRRGLNPGKEHPMELLSFTRSPQRAALIRDAVVRAGIDGAVAALGRSPDFEFVFFNPSVLKARKR